MPHVPEDLEPDNWHRYFAMENNNRAWQLAVEDRTAEQDLEMLDAAHASALHWSAIGTELNRMRAKTLLAEVHALLGFGHLRSGTRMRFGPIFLDRETADWELAYIHVIHAHAAAAAGERQLHSNSYAAAGPAIDAIADEEDRPPDFCPGSTASMTTSISRQISDGVWDLLRLGVLPRVTRSA